jgi:predicted deacylase
MQLKRLIHPAPWAAAAAVLCTGLAAGPAAGVAAPTEWGALTLLERSIAPGEKRKFYYIGGRTFEGAFLDTAVFAARGTQAGPTLCLTALLHGDERNGFEVARQAFAEIDAGALRGTLIALPAVNMSGFRTGSRYMPDRRDLNRAFPGDPKGSNTALVASIVFETLRNHCSALIDLHTGSFERSNLPQVRVDLGDARALELARVFGAAVVLGGAGPRGSLRREMMEAGVTTLLYEAGLPLRFEPHEIERGVQGVRNVMVHLGMSAGTPTAATPADHVYSRTSWLRAPVGQGGVFYPRSALGETVRTGDVLAHIDDPFTDQRYELKAPYGGRIIGMAVPQVVFSGYALLHIARD